MSKLTLRSEHHFGIYGPIQENVLFISDSRIVYPIGNHVAIYDLHLDTFSYCTAAHEIRSVHAISVNSTLEYMAIAERHNGNDKIKNGEEDHRIGCSMISIYATNTLQRLKCIMHTTSANIISLAFSFNSRILVTLDDGKTTASINYWNWNAKKCVSSATSPPGGTRIRISNADATFLTVSGHKHLKVWTLLKSELKMSTLVPLLREQENFVDHIWVSEHIVVISDHGSVHCFAPSSNATMGYELVHSITIKLSNQGRLETVVKFKRGFVVAGTVGHFSIFEPTDDPMEPFGIIRALDLTDVDFDAVSIAPDNDTVVGHTKAGYITSFSLGRVDIIQDGEVETSMVFDTGSLLGVILSIDTCLQRPILVSCSTDRCIRIWNYKTKKCELTHVMAEDLTAIALHPSGYQLLASTKERIFVYNVLHDELRLFRELVVKSCKEMEYANGGHYFAVAIGLAIHIYNSYTYESCMHMTAHISPVRRLKWSFNDQFLYSAGSDGGIYGWNIATGTRMDNMQNVVKQCSYAGLIVDKNNPEVVVAAGNDGYIREIVSGEQTKQFAISSDGMSVTYLLGYCNYILAGTTQGSIVVYPYPLKETSPLVEYGVHRSAITKLCISSDGQILFSASEDGSIALLRLHLEEEHSTKFISHVHESVLIGREEIEELRFQLSELKMKYEQIKSDTDYSLHRQESEWVDRLRGGKEDALKILALETKRYNELLESSEREKRVHSNLIDERDVAHVKITQEMENRYEHKLANEMGKNDACAEEMESLRQKFEKLLETQNEHHERISSKERGNYDVALSQQNTIIKTLHEDFKYNEVKFEEVLSQQEKEYEMELQKVKDESHDALVSERKILGESEGNMTVLMNKNDALLTKIREAKVASQSRDTLLATEKAKNGKLEETLVLCETHIEEHEASLAGKEKQLFELRASNRTLDNSRFALDQSVQALQLEQGPTQEHIDKLEALIRDMHDELTGEFQRKSLLGSEMAAKDLQVKALRNAVAVLRNSTRESERLNTALTREVTRIANMNNLKEVGDAIRHAYKIYVKGETEKSASPKKKSPKRKKAIRPDKALPVKCVGDEEAPGDPHAAQESSRQISFMHRSLDTVNASLKNQKIDAEKARRLSVSQNSLLINECNRLRQENKSLSLRVNKFEANEKQHTLSPVKQPLPLPSTVSLLPSTRPVSKGSSMLKNRLIPISTPTSRGKEGSVVRGGTTSFSQQAVMRARHAASTKGFNDYDEQLKKQREQITRLSTQLNLLLSEKEDCSIEEAEEVLEEYGVSRHDVSRDKKVYNRQKKSSMNTNNADQVFIGNSNEQ